MDDYIKSLLDFNPKYDEDLLTRAYETATKLHKDQKRRSGEPYIIHPKAVAIILAELGMDDKTLAAGLLHDVVEDTSYTLDQLKSEFGEEIAELVDGVTKLTNLNYSSKAESQAATTRKMFLAMAKDIRVVVIKLCDRIHNLRTIQFQSDEKRKEKCQESLEIYAPLAARLGIYKFKFEIEDICFKNLDEDQYNKICNQMSEIRNKRKKNVDELVAEATDIVKELGITFECYGREKHLYSIYKKMQIQKKELDEIFDLTAIRIIVGSIKDCYAVLGAVHTKWTPIPGRFKDYIAMPKPNNYQSLHTTVMTDMGFPFEIQIRTYEMHHIAEYGIAAHWKYKEGIAADDEEVKLAWIRQTLEWQKDASDNTDFVDTLKTELFSNQVFVFTPKGDVMELPAGATPLDFAFKVHSNVGNKCVGAKVNGKIVNLDYTLQNGDRVEVMTNKSFKGPSADWLNIVKTNSARTKIRQWLNKQEKEEQSAKEKLEKERLLLKSEEEKKIESAISIDLSEATVLEHVKPKRSKNDQGISVKGVGNLYIRFAKCCNPVPGDEIIGYTTKGRGVAVHRKDCDNIVHLPQDERIRLIDVEWTTQEGGMLFDANVTIKAKDRKGLVADISSITESMDINISSVSMRRDVDDAFLELTLEISNSEDVEKVLSRFRTVKGVYDAYRTHTQKE